MPGEDEISATDSELSGAFVEAIQRQRAADGVYGWLMRQQRLEDTRDKSKVPLHEKAREVLAGLQEGEIFFIVQDPSEMEELVKARKLLVQGRSIGTRSAVALAVRSDVTREQLLSQGKESLEELFTLHSTMERHRDRRLFVQDKAVIKMNGIGAFPESVRE